MLFFKSWHDEQTLTYEDVLNCINSNEPVIANFREKNTAKFLLNLIKALCNNVDVLILDFDFSDDEILKYTGKTYESQFHQNSLVKVNTINEIAELIKNSTSVVSIFTSGTTGQPKSVNHSVQTLIREVRISDKHKNDIWGLAYNPTHIAGLQVIFQALLNLNALIFLFEAPADVIFNLIKQNNITHLSATPTFYRVLLPAAEQFNSIKNISLGGEKASEQLLNFINQTFPLAKITNIYASTEAGTLLATHGVGFQIPKHKRELIKVEDFEIKIHKSLLGKAESFNNSEWYATGDLIEWIDETNFVFKIVNRKNELLNIGGNKVNPNEIEALIESFEGVQAVLVYGKPNSVIGTILCCDIQADNTVTEAMIKSFLKDKVQPFKVPRIFQFKENLQTTRNGKIKRVGDA